MEDPFDTVARLVEHTLFKDGHWRYKLHQYNGYGVVGYGNKWIGVHRLSACIYLGLNLEDRAEMALHKDDICPYKNCWNPYHLYIGSQSDNVVDAYIKHGLIGASLMRSKRTHCPLGHEYTAINTYIKQGTRSCKACRKIRNDKRRRG